MSYEGYEQHVCANGHRFSVDAHFYEENDDVCPECGNHSVFCNPVEDTNGESFGEIREEDWEPFRLTNNRYDTCNLDHRHLVESEIFRVPTAEEARAIRSYFDGKDWKRVNP